MLKPYVFTLMASVGAGVLFKFLNIPLPWMLGPMAAVGWAGVRGSGPKAIPGGRQAGQLIIGCSLGLYFTEEVSRQLLDFGVYIFLSAFISILIGALVSQVFQRISGATAVSAFFACVPGGATEMALLAERAGARFDTVAFSHSARILLVVLIAPAAVTFSGARGNIVFEPSANAFLFLHFAGMLGLAAASSLVFARLRIPNAWLLAPLTVSWVWTVSGYPVSSVPSSLVSFAQILIGCALGVGFKPNLRAESGRLIAAAGMTAMLTLLACAALGAGFAWMMGESVTTLILATSPGGLSEMCITAKILKLGVPLVTSFQAVRLVVVVIFAFPVWRGLLWLGRMRLGKK